MKVDVCITTAISDDNRRSNAIVSRDIKHDIRVSVFPDDETTNKVLKIIMDDDEMIKVYGDMSQEIFIVPDGWLRFAGESFIRLTIYAKDDEWFIYFTGDSADDTTTECIKPGWGITVEI